MQELQPGDKHFAESPASLANSANGEFAQDKQTAGIVPEQEMEIVQTHYSPRGVVLLYFQGDASTEVDKHFNRTFSELCCFPESAENSIEGSRLQGALKFELFVTILYSYMNSSLLKAINNCNRICYQVLKIYCG